MDLRDFHPGRPPVVLLGGLNVARAAGLGGIPVIVASDDPATPAFHSRYCAGKVLLKSPLEDLLRLGERLAAHLGRPVPLFCGNDDDLDLLLANRGRLGACYRFVINDAHVAAALLDKERFDPFMRSRGLPSPRVLEWHELRGFGGAVLAKPKVKLDFEVKSIRDFLGGKARVFGNGRAVLEAPGIGEHRDELLFQEYVTGDERRLWSFHGYADADARLLAWFIGRKIRCFPPVHGESAYIELARNDELAQLGREFVARVPLKGVFKVDFKQDAATKRWVVLEVNARFTLWHYLAAANGLNLPRIVYDHQVDGVAPASPPAYATKYRWLSLKKDWRGARRRRMPLRAWLASLAAPKVYNFWSWRDPRPAIAMVLERAARRLPRCTVRFTRWLFPAS